MPQVFEGVSQLQHFVQYMLLQFSGIVVLAEGLPFGELLGSLVNPLDDEVDAFLRRSNLYMPSVKEFLTFYTALRDASQEKITLKDADGKDIPHEVSKNLWFGLVKSEDTLEYALWLDTEEDCK